MKGANKMRKVFMYDLKKLIIPYSIYLGIMSIICFSFMLSAERETYSSFIGMISAFMLLLIFGTILYGFMYNKRKISADMYYSLPVTKRQLFLGKYLASLVGILVLSILYIGICFIVFGIAVGLKKMSFELLPLEEQAMRLLISSVLRLVFSIPLFNFCLLFFYKANSLIDGIIYVSLGCAIVYLIVEIFSCFILDFSYFPSLPIFVFTHGIDQILYGSYFSVSEEVITFYTMIYILYALLGYGLIAYLLWWVKKDSAIRTQEISHQIFGYKVFLPMTAICIMLFSFIDEKMMDGMNSVNGIVYFIQFILITIGLFIVYCIYHRYLMFNKMSYLTFGIVTGINLILLILI